MGLGCPSCGRGSQKRVGGCPSAGGVAIRGKVCMYSGMPINCNKSTFFLAATVSSSGPGDNEPDARRNQYARKGGLFAYFISAVQPLLAYPLIPADCFLTVHMMCSTALVRSRATRTAQKTCVCYLFPGKAICLGFHMLLKRAERIKAKGKQRQASQPFLGKCTKCNR